MEELEEKGGEKGKKWRKVVDFGGKWSKVVDEAKIGGSELVRVEKRGGGRRVSWYS